jgi:hypothetical protein
MFEYVCLLFVALKQILSEIIQVGSNMTGTDLCVNKSQFVPVIFEPPCII